MNTSASYCMKCRHTKIDTNALYSRADVESRVGLEVCYRPDLNFGGFRSQFEASNVSSHTERNSLFVNDYIYIFVE